MSRPKPHRSKSRRSNSPNRGRSPSDREAPEGDRPRRPVRPRPSEQILIDALDQITGAEAAAGRILSTSLGRGQFAAAAARADASRQVHCSFLDLYALEQARLQQANPPANLHLESSADFPDGPFDAVVLPVSAAGEAELVRDWLQSGHERLRLGGAFFTATDNPADVWLHGELKKLFPKITRQAGERGTLFKAIKTEPLKKLKNYECRFAFRDGDRLVQAVSRPSVFSHRRVDGGARALLRAAQIGTGDHVLELGCGSGIVSLAAALRAPSGQVLAVDSNPRAAECTRRGAELNGITNFDVRLSTAESHVGDEIPGSEFDLVLANPPYYSNFRIAEIFAACAARALKPSGSALFVTKRTDWYTEQLPRWFGNVAIEPIGNYAIVRAAAPRGS